MKNIAAAIVCFIAAIIIFMLFILPCGNGVKVTVATLSIGALVAIGFENLLRFEERNQKP